MRSLSLCLFFLGLACCGTAQGSATSPAPSAACVVVTRPASNEPPAWLLLAAAVTLLGAGRLAAT